jgi:hypothetical protein
LFLARIFNDMLTIVCGDMRALNDTGGAYQ